MKSIRNTSTETIDSLCKLIQTCGKSGVSELIYENIKVAFKSETMPRMLEPMVSKLEPSNSPAIASDSRMTQLDQALIEDPIEYERLLISGELDDAEVKD